MTILFINVQVLKIMLYTEARFLQSNGGFIIFKEFTKPGYMRFIWLFKIFKTSELFLV